jgi:hypothetical protein
VAVLVGFIYRCAHFGIQVLVLNEKWYPFYILALAAFVWAISGSWFPVLLVIGLVGLAVYRFFNCRDLERVTSVAIVLLGLLLIAGVRSGYVNGLFMLAFVVDLVF